MTNRTAQIYGYGFGSTDATMTVTLDNVTVFTGPVTTANSPVPNPIPLGMPVNICSFELPVGFSGTKPMTCTVTNGTIIFGVILANYCYTNNPIYSSAELDILYNRSLTHQDRYNIYAEHANPPFTQDETATLMSSVTPYNDPAKIAILQSRNLLPKISSGPDGFESIFDSDPRTDVTIDGLIPLGTSPQGTITYTVPSGSTLAYDLNVNAGIE